FIHCFFSFLSLPALPALHSFPTRRSSDLLNLLPIQGHQGGIGQAPGDGLLAVLASQEWIRAALDARTVLAFNHEKLFGERATPQDRKSTRLNSSHVSISYAVFCLKKKNK